MLSRIFCPVFNEINYLYSTFSAKLDMEFFSQLGRTPLVQNVTKVRCLPKSEKCVKVMIFCVKLARYCNYLKYSNYSNYSNI